ncbi:MAG: tetratricopeptide repeat protein [Bacteroidota bacterium]
MEKHLKNRSAGKVSASARYDLTDRKNYLWIIAILAITFIVFIPAIRNLFLTFDDNGYVVENSFITAFSAVNLKAIFLSDANNLGNYHPLTLLSFALNYSVSGLNPTAFHLTNILLHLINVFLVFQISMLLFARLGAGNRQMLSAIAALLFGIHPLHVESVAWVSGRKDLLYTCFYLLALISYLRYLDKKELRRYWLSLLFFILSLLSKGMAVTLSLSFVAVDYLYKRDLLARRVILEKIPFFALSILQGIITVIVQQAQGATGIIKYGFADRLVIASFGFTQYLVKMAIPYKLCGYYPYPDLAGTMFPWSWYLSILPVLAVGFFLVYFAFFRPNRTIIFGSLFFILNVILVLQIFPVGSAVMADRYTYLSSFGLFFLVAWGIGFLFERFASTRVLVAGLFVLYAAGLSAGSNQRCRTWHDSYSFWNDVMEKYPHFYPAINNLGVFNEKEGNMEEAFRLFDNSIRVNQHNPEAYFHRGSIYGKAGQSQEAISDFTQAIGYSPTFTKAYINRAIARAMIRDYPGAMADLDRVLAKEKNGEAFLNRGIMLNEIKRYDQAIPDLQEAVKLDPSCVKCCYSLGLACYNARRYPEAINAFSTCIGLEPAYGSAYYYRALSGIESGKGGSSCNDLQKAVSLGIREAEPLLDQYCRQ